MESVTHNLPVNCSCCATCSSTYIMCLSISTQLLPPTACHGFVLLGDVDELRGFISWPTVFLGLDLQPLSSGCSLLVFVHQRIKLINLQINRKRFRLYLGERFKSQPPLPQLLFVRPLWLLFNGISFDQPKSILIAPFQLRAMASVIPSGVALT